MSVSVLGFYEVSETGHTVREVFGEVASDDLLAVSLVTHQAFHGLHAHKVLVESSCGPYYRQASISRVF